MEILKLKNISKFYDKEPVLSNLNLSIADGEMVAIIGASGQGKTTLLNIMGLISQKDDGDLILYNHKNPNINSREAMMLRRDKIGYLFQNYGLVDDETVFWNLKLALEYKKYSKNEKVSKINNLLESFNLLNLKNKKVYQLSGGEQQRIAIIRLILQDSSLILADEPTASLDSDNQKVIMEYLKALNNKGKTIVVVTHTREILSYFTRVINLHDLIQ